MYSSSKTFAMAPSFWYQQLPRKPTNAEKPQDSALSQKRNYTEIEGYTQGALETKKSNNETKNDDGGMDITSKKYGGDPMELSFPLLDYWGAGSGASGPSTSTGGNDAYEGRHPESTAINTDDDFVSMSKEKDGYEIDTASLYYEMTVGRLMGRKKAFNSTQYGELDPSLESVRMQKNKRIHRVKNLSNVDQGFVMSETPSGKRPHTSMAAKDFTEPMAVGSHPGREGALIINRGMNQFRNPTVKRKTRDMDFGDVNPVTPQSQDIVINGNPIEPQNKLQYKTSEADEDGLQGGYLSRQFFGNSSNPSTRGFSGGSTLSYTPAPYNYTGSPGNAAGV